MPELNKVRYNIFAVRDYCSPYHCDCKIMAGLAHNHVKILLFSRYVACAQVYVHCLPFRCFHRRLYDSIKQTEYFIVFHAVFFRGKNHLKDFLGHVVADVYPVREAVFYPQRRTVTPYAVAVLYVVVNKKPVVQHFTGSGKRSYFLRASTKGLTRGNGKQRPQLLAACIHVIPYSVVQVRQPVLWEGCVYFALYQRHVTFNVHKKTLFVKLKNKIRRRYFSSTITNISRPISAGT